MAHDELINGVVHDFFDQDVDPIVAGGAIAQLADVHARAQADVLAPVQGTDIVFGIKSG